ncbi:mediator complex, subunit Med11 [Biscogniauxia mediterranea]|nr:mediator complex, subunit Med11 [Biscogniauxia mediterranea]
MDNKEQTSFVPFTKAERIQQLGDIDRNIVRLLTSTAQAIQGLVKNDTPDGDVMMTEEDQGTQGTQSQVFQKSMDDFLRTLRAVNVGMKRQIWGLEEAGIITLSKKDNQSIREENGEVQMVNTRSGPLEPDGNGRIGGLDVGWLNSRSNKVERDMEAHMWDEAEAIMNRVMGAANRNPDTPYGMSMS